MTANKDTPQRHRTKLRAPARTRSAFLMGWSNPAARLRAPLLLIYYAQDIPCRPQQNELMYHSLKRFCPDAPVSLLSLPGGHCAGSSQADANGDFPFITALKRFVRADAAK